MNAFLTRRGFLATGASGLVVSFALGGFAAAQQALEAEELPGSLDDAPMLDSWIRIGPEGEITVFTGKAELGQGLRTALAMVAAEELGVGAEEIELITADTGRTPDEGFTAGSNSMAESGTAVRYAAASVRQLLLDEAARRWTANTTDLRVESKRVVAGDGRTLGYGELAAGMNLKIPARADVPLMPPRSFAVMGTDLPRVDIPGKVTGAPAYVHDLRPEGMLHARLVRPPSPAAELVAVDTGTVEAMPGFVAVVRDGSFLAVIAEREFQAVLAMRALASAAEWRERESLPEQSRLYDVLRELETEVGTVAEAGSPQVPDGERTRRMTFTRPYMMHGSIGPSCAVALMEGDALTVWSHTQGVYPDREAISELLGMPLERVRVIHLEGAGCYGHNGADDAAADAALIARALPSRPVRVQWTREQEHGWEPYGPAMTMDIAGAVGEDGRISHFTYDLWSNSHSTRPGGAARLMAAQHLANPVPFDLPGLNISASGNGDRNANPYYAIPNKRVLWHYVNAMPLRVSALRALGAYANVFALESFIDELALVAGADPVEFRLRHLEDPRAVAVVETAAEAFGWSSEPLPPNHGRGFAFARYKNLAAYLALALDLEVTPETGRVQVRRAVSAVDSGEAVHPDGIRNQTEGGILQALSWTLLEEVTFDRTRVTSIDWSSYPILRFGSVPDTVEVHVVGRPGEPFLGTGEAAAGPTPAAIGNAIRNATGVRMRDLPLTPDRVRRAILA
jgi:nicotinate dehydrogenase subunit B